MTLLRSHKIAPSLRCHITIPSASTRLTVTFLYSLPLTVLKSSAGASDAESDAKIANAICRCFTGRILLLLFPETQRQIIGSHTQSLCASHSEAAKVCREVEVRVRACRFRIPIAGVAELADALDSKSSGRKVVWVRAPPPAMNSQFNVRSDAQRSMESTYRLDSSGKKRFQTNS